jgi:O-antigen ligase
MLWLGALLLLPLTIPYRSLPLTNFYHDAVAYSLAAAGAAWLLRGGKKGHVRSLRVPHVAVAPLALLAVLVVQQLLGMIEYLQHFVVPAFVLSVTALSLVVGFRVLRPQMCAALTAICWTIVAAAAVNAIWGGVQLAGYEVARFELLRRGEAAFRVSGLLAQPNQLATLCALACVAVVYLWQREAISPWLAVFFASVFTCVAVTAGSKSAYLYFPLIGCGLSLAMSKGGRSSLWWLPGAWGLAYLPLATSLDSWLAALFGARGLEVDRSLTGSSTAARLAFIADGWELFTQAPLLGHGWHEFTAARWRLPQPTPHELHADHAHNAMIQLLAETGLVGLLAVAIPLLFWLRRAISPSGFDLERVAALALLSVIALYSLLEFPLWLGHFLIPTTLLIGMLETRGLTFQVTAAFARLARTVVAAMPIAVIATTFDYARTERVFHSMMDERPERRYTVQQIAQLSTSTLFRREAEIAFALSAPIDAAHAALNLDLSERVFLLWPVAQPAFLYAAYLLYAQRTEEAIHVIARTCSWSERECGILRTLFATYADNGQEPFTRFYRRAFGASQP